MNQSTTTQTKSRYRPVKVTADGLPGGPLPAQSVANNPAARPAIIRTIVSPGSKGQPAKVVLARQDEMSQPTPRMLPAERLQRYVQELTVPDSPQPDAAATPSIEPPVVDSGASGQNQFSNSIVTWSTPQASRAINLSEASLIQPVAIHPAHSDPKPHLQGWPDEAEVAAEIEQVTPNEVSSKEVSSKEAASGAEDQLDQASKIDEQLRQLELRIGQLRSQEAAKSEYEKSAREQEILANPNTGELVAAISTAIVSALQEKSEADVLPQAKSLFEERLQQHAVTLGELGDSVGESNGPEQLGSEAMFSSIAAQRQQEQESAAIVNTHSPTELLGELRERIADYQRAMTGQTTAEAADLIKLSETDSLSETHSLSEPNLLSESAPVYIDPTTEAEPTPAAIDSSATHKPLVKFTAPEDTAVPLEAASWDVEDFRWSSITNQMLTSGSEAIKNLLGVTLGRTSVKTKRVVIAGAGRDQGTTTIATALARAGNEAGCKTLLIDADVASPQLSQTVGLSAKMSWVKGIGSDLPLGEMVIRSKKTNLCLMPLSATVNRVTLPRFIFDNLGEMLVNAESYFDLILIDAGPASQLLDELSNPEQLLDAMVLVDSTAKLKDIEVYQNRLQTFGIDNLVLAENRKPESTSDAA